MKTKTAATAALYTAKKHPCDRVKFEVVEVPFGYKVVRVGRIRVIKSRLIHTLSGACAAADLFAAAE